MTPDQTPKNSPMSSDNIESELTLTRQDSSSVNTEEDEKTLITRTRQHIGLTTNTSAATATSRRPTSRG